MLTAGRGCGVNCAGRVETGKAFGLAHCQGSSSQAILTYCDATFCFGAQRDHAASDEAHLRERASDFGGGDRKS
jgi:hypothetical protein